MSKSFTEKPVDRPAPQAPAGESAVPPGTRSARAMLRYVLPGILFVFVVGAIAWITQFMPNWRVKTDTQPAANTSGAMIKFTFNRAVWDPDDDKYALEMEPGQDGHFDFPFENTSDQ